jgi:hypothetical protein
MSRVSGLAAFLTEQRADPATLQHAVRSLVAEWAGDPTVEAMQTALAAQALEADRLEPQLQQLRRDAQLLEAASLAVLEAAWEDPQLHDAARGAIADAGEKLPIHDHALIAIVVCYGIYLAATGGRKRQRHSIVRRPDGSYEEEIITEWYGPAGVLRALADVLRLPGGDSPPELTEESEE